MDRSLRFSKFLLLRIFAALMAVVSTTGILSAQSTNPSTTVEYIKLQKFQSTYKDYHDDFRLKFYPTTGGSICIEQYGKDAFTYYYPNTSLYTNVSRSLQQDISMSIEAWEEESHYECGSTSSCGKGSCDYNSGCNCTDDWHCETSNGDKTFKLFDFEPGIEQTVHIQYCNNDIVYAFKYRPTEAYVTGVTYGKNGNENIYTKSGGNICADNTVRIAVGTAMKSDYSSKLQYVWEYNIGNEQARVWVPNPDYCGDSPRCNGGSTNPTSFEQSTRKASGNVSPLKVDPGTGDTPPPPCCSVSPGSYAMQTKWTTLKTTYGSTDQGALTLNLLDLSQINTLTSNSYIQFRIRTVANGTSADSYGSTTIQLSPKAPVLGSVEELASCPNTPSGIVKLSGIEGSGKYQYTIRNGHNNNEPCTPVAGCLTGIKSGEIIGTSGEITPIAGGEYTLWISNYGGDQGVCSSTKNITIPTIPVLSIKDAAPQKDATCNGYADGEIKLTYSGGIAPYTYTLTNNPSNATGVFSGLKAGTYTGSVTDGCQQVNTATSKQITIAEPKSIKANVAGSTLTCNSPADGTIVTTITDGPDMYNYYLKQAGSTLSKVENTGITSWNVSNRAAGSYLIEIVDYQRPACPGFSSTVTLTAPPVLNITQSNVTMTNVSCNDGSDGKVTLVNMDMSGKYNYILTRGSDNAIYTTSTAPDIENLRGAEYKLAMKRNIAGCNDIYTYPSLLIITQPTPIAIGLNKQDISCFGLTDGKISATVTGGTGPSYTYTWEQSTGSSWSTLASGSSTLSGRAEGTYRLRVKDTNSCPAVSDPIAIAEPSRLTITSASVQDIKCFGDKGYIAMTAEGGTGTPVYQYSLGSSYTTFNSATPLTAGIYVVRAMDKNNCTSQYADKLSITTPASALGFTYTKSDYNGVNISCFNGANGYVTLAASGGNGGTFSGYTYAIDTNPYQDAERIEGIQAGSHTLYVKDGRGCIKSQVASFTQSTEKLTLKLVSKNDVACFGDNTGMLEVTGAGGISPYDYNIDAGVNQSLGKFTGLGAGSHAIQLTDKNNCANSYDFEIKSLNPVIEINPTVSDVKCFEGSDGKIALVVSGGVAPFTYLWAGQASTASELASIKSGDYKVTVTDKAGCKMDKAFTVNQPAQALKISVATVPVCYGMSNGLIVIASSGGTSPYFYSVDNGTVYQASEVFNTVGIGSYTIRVKDSNDCFVTASTEVVQRNDKPEPDFIVATKESALDTLVITEISVPKPDSIQWLFDPATIVLDNNSWQPKIKFSTEGNYTLGMKGFFGGCAYTVTRSLTINAYDPESAKTKLPEYKAIKSVEVTPNPNAGQFTVTVRLNYKHSVSMVVYDIVGGTHYQGSWRDVDALTETITLNNVASGVYLLRVVTPSDAEDIRILINK
jgi:hypothetical protein